MRVTSLLLSSTHFLFVLFHPQRLVQAEDTGEVEQEQFYCDDSGDALDFVPASRTCRIFAGQTRCWFTYTPEEDEQESVPLVLDLHGFSSCAAYRPEVTGWRELAADQNFYVVWPQGTNNILYAPIPCWNAGYCCCEILFDNIPDDRLLNHIIERTIEESEGRIDPKRVYIAGHSNGCFMSQTFAKEFPGVVAGVVCHSGVMIEDHPSEDDPDWTPTTIVTVHGDEDLVVPYFNNPIHDHGAPENIDLWGQSNGCSKKTVVPEGPYRTHTWTGCTGNKSTRLYQIIGAGHSPYASDGYVDATALAWEYIKTVSLDPDCPEDQAYASIEITTDENPSETSWSVALDTADNIIFEGGDYTEQNFKYTFSNCVLVPSCYIITIYDSGGDGLSGDGGYKIYSNGNVKNEGTFESGFEKTVLIGCD